MGETKKDAKAEKVDDHIINRYDLKKRLGKGAYGIVWKAIDTHTNDVVAVKKIFDAFRNQTDAQRTFREIMFLQAFKEHPNIITLRGLHKASNNRDIYLVFDFMETDLHNVIKRATILKECHKRYIMYQLFKATQYLHSGNVIHRDQKPSNVLVNTDCKIKIADFGLARSLTHCNVEDEDDGILTDYVATRWYRAPEILVASKKYTKGVDMWSLGCILGEMLLGKPLFPGSSTINQMEKIMAVLPEPTPLEVYNMCSGYGKGLLDGYTGPKTTLEDLVHDPCEEAMDLLHRLLVFDPAKRLTAAESLKHPYVSRHWNGKELILDRDVIPPLDDDVQLSVSDYRNKLYEMIASARLKRKQSKADTTSPITLPSPQEISERKYQQKNSDKYGKSSESMQRMSQADKYLHGESRTAEGSLRRRHKQQVEDSRESRDNIKEKRDAREKQKLPSTGTDYNQKTVSGHQKKKANSPNRPMVPSRVGANWPDRQRILYPNQKVPLPIKNRYDEGPGGDGVVLKPTSNTAPTPFRTALAQVREKLRQAQALNNQLTSLPKVSHKRDLHQTFASPSHVNRYNSRHGILTASDLQEIRNVLKH